MSALAPPALRLPPWARKGSPLLPAARGLRVLLRQQSLTTVCEEARCPNLGECFSRGTATFMLLGDRCTRRCAYCSVATARPSPPDPGEPARVAEAAARLGLRYVVLTAVARDDLRDGGAAHFAAAIGALRGRLLAAAKRQGQPTKSGLMVGLGETDGEVDGVLLDLRSAGVDIVTIGQYLRPTRNHAPVHRYLAPEGFRRFEERARDLGFPTVYSGVFVRSSFNAEEVAGRHGFPAGTGEVARADS